MKPGKYTADVYTKWLPDGRFMELVFDVAYIDSNGYRWLAEAGTLINGASIPNLVWEEVGSPYVGLYRRASVIHDAMCNLREKCGRSSDDVHRMFREAMFTDGVSRKQRNMMFAAVRMFGPRWKVPDTVSTT